MKTNPSHQTPTTTTPTRRHFLAKGISRLFAASLLGSLLVAGTTAEARPRVKRTQFQNLGTNLSAQNTHKNGTRIIIRGRLMYQSEKGDYRYLDKPSVQVKLEIGGQTYYDTTDNLGWATFDIVYRHGSPIPNGRSVRVGWFLRFDGIAGFLGSTTSPGQYFQVVN
jgi:hypothetical protein